MRRRRSFAWRNSAEVASDEPGFWRPAVLTLPPHRKWKRSTTQGRSAPGAVHPLFHPPHVDARSEWVGRDVFVTIAEFERRVVSCACTRAVVSNECATSFFLACERLRRRAWHAAASEREAWRCCNRVVSCVRGSPASEGGRHVSGERRGSDAAEAASHQRVRYFLSVGGACVRRRGSCGERCLVCGGAVRERRASAAECGSAGARAVSERERTMEARGGVLARHASGGGGEPARERRAACAWRVCRVPVTYYVAVSCRARGGRCKSQRALSELGEWCPTGGGGQKLGGRVFPFLPSASVWCVWRRMQIPTRPYDARFLTCVRSDE